MVATLKLLHGINPAIPNCIKPNHLFMEPKSQIYPSIIGEILKCDSKARKITPSAGQSVLIRTKISQEKYETPC